MIKIWSAIKHLQGRNIDGFYSCIRQKKKKRKKIRKQVE